MTSPIPTETAPWLLLLVAVPLFLAVALVSLSNGPRVRRWMSAAAAGLKVLLLGFLGVAALIVWALPESNADALVGLAVLLAAMLLLGPALVYVGVVVATLPRAIWWRVLAAIMDAGISWLIVSNLIIEGLNRSQPFWAGTVRHPIYSPPEYGNWPLVVACGIGAVWLALTMFVIVNAIPETSVAARVRTAAQSLG